MPLTASVTVNAVAEFTKTMDLSTPVDLSKLLYSKSWPEGSGSGQAQKVFHDTRTLTSGSSENLDLYGGLTDAYGTTLNFATVKAICIVNLSTVQTLTIGNVTNAWHTWIGAETQSITIPPSGMWLMTAPLAGFAVTTGTDDLLKVANSSGSSCDYSIWIIGT